MEEAFSRTVKMQKLDFICDVKEVWQSIWNMMNNMHALQS